jgi:uncharacterized ferritin-like protein (DUF455 family)
MNINEFAKSILLGDSLEEKLLTWDQSGVNIDWGDPVDFVLPKTPARAKKIILSEKNIRFPKGHLHENEKKAIALNSFANHELLATEMMAAALLIYPHHTDELKKFKLGILSALQDEQKHFRLYTERLNEIGYEFGDFPLNDFFWRQMEKLKTPSQYLSTMALTFEAANLDFAFHYQKMFEEIGDFKTASVLEIVVKEEISHVGLGIHYLNKWKGDKTLWEYYRETLPYPLTPARAKGKIFNTELREKAKMPPEFITGIKDYDDDFKVTKRKEWK